MSEEQHAAVVGATRMGEASRGFGDASPADHDPADAVELRVPADLRSLRLLRLVAAGVADPQGRLDLDTLDDLRIAVDELCTLALEAAAGSATALVARFRCIEGRFELAGVLPGVQPSHPDALRPTGLTATILDAVTTDHRLSLSEEGIRFALCKVVDGT